MADWIALARARELKIPDEAMAAIAPSLEALHQDFRRLTPRLDLTTEPAIHLSESAVFGE